MKYPTVTRKTTETAVARYLAGSGIGLHDHEWTWSGSGTPIDLDRIASCADDIEAMRQDYVSEGKTDADHLEGRAAQALHRELRDVDVIVLDDPGFWRYLGLEYFWPLIHWREHNTFETGLPAKYLVYVDAVRTSESVLTRMFLRAATVVDHDDYELVAAAPEATDFWRSHVLRVSVGSAPPVARAFARLHAEHRLPTSELRPFARRLNRLVTNLVLPMVDEQQAAETLAEIDLRSPQTS